jgi:hypothetical protein
MVVFGLVSAVKGAFGDDVNFVVVTKMAFTLDASPSASVLALDPSCASRFALVPLLEHHW